MDLLNILSPIYIMPPVNPDWSDFKYRAKLPSSFLETNNSGKPLHSLRKSFEFKNRAKNTFMGL